MAKSKEKIVYTEKYRKPYAKMHPDVMPKTFGELDVRSV